MQRILAEVHGVSERQRRWPRRVRIVSVEAVAEQWLVPRVATFTAAHPGVAIELEPNHRGVDPDRRDVDAWLAYTGETAAPRPVTRREDTLLEDTLYEEPLRPVCSPALLAARGRPSGPADLGDWPLLYDLGWDADGAYWCARQGQTTPDLSRASGFRLYSMLVQAAVTGLGAAIGRPMLIARELENRTLVPLFDRRAEAPERCCLITTAAARQRPEVRACRAWILDEARAATRAGADASRAQRCRVRSASAAPRRQSLACVAAWVASASHASAAARWSVAAVCAASTTCAARAWCAASDRAASARVMAARMASRRLAARVRSLFAAVVSRSVMGWVSWFVVWGAARAGAQARRSGAWRGRRG